MAQAARKTIIFLASGAGVGFLPKMPGTFGTLEAVPVSFAINRIALTDPLLAVGVLGALVIGSIVIAHGASRLLGTKDPQVVVIDEIAGFALANFMSETSSLVIAAFLLFRVFDIAKVFPARRLEKLPGGLGIVLDDLLAGFYTFLIVRGFSGAGLI